MINIERRYKIKARYRKEETKKEEVVETTIENIVENEEVTDTEVNTVIEAPIIEEETKTEQVDGGVVEENKTASTLADFLF